jgi:hypothetical protein
MLWEMEWWSIGKRRIQETEDRRETEIPTTKARKEENTK